MAARTFCCSVRPVEAWKPGPLPLRCCSMSYTCAFAEVRVAPDSMRFFSCSASSPWAVHISRIPVMRARSAICTRGSRVAEFARARITSARVMERLPLAPAAGSSPSGSPSPDPTPSMLTPFSARTSRIWSTMPSPSTGSPAGVFSFFCSGSSAGSCAGSCAGSSSVMPRARNSSRSFARRRSFIVRSLPACWAVADLLGAISARIFALSSAPMGQSDNSNIFHWVDTRSGPSNRRPSISADCPSLISM